MSLFLGAIIFLSLIAYQAVKYLGQNPGPAAIVILICGVLIVLILARISNPYRDRLRRDARIRREANRQAQENQANSRLQQAAADKESRRIQAALKAVTYDTQGVSSLAKAIVDELSRAGF
jgi:biopolymer transport protein ExbB/TolQ